MSRDRVTAVLADACRGGFDRSVVDRLVPLVYDELRRMARRQLGRDGHRLTLDTTALVHEAYVRLAASEALPVASRAYFFGAAARAMRQVLVDAARRRNRTKRGGGAGSEELRETTGRVNALAEDLLALDRALERLAVTHPRAAQVLEWRYFSGLSVEEIGAALRLAVRTVSRDLTFARAWLRLELGPALPAGQAETRPP